MNSCMDATREGSLRRAGLGPQHPISSSTAAAGLTSYAAAAASARPCVTLGPDVQHNTMAGAALAIFSTLCGAAQSIEPLVRAVGGDAAGDTALAFAVTLGKLGRGDLIPASVAVRQVSLPVPTGSETISATPLTVRLCPTCRGPVRPLGRFERRALDPNSPDFRPSFQVRVKCDDCRAAIQAAREASGWRPSSVQHVGQPSVQPAGRPWVQPAGRPAGKPAGRPSVHRYGQTCTPYRPEQSSVTRSPKT